MKYSGELVLSPEGHVYIEKKSTSDEQIDADIFDEIEALFAESPTKGLLHLGIREFTTLLPPSFLFWRSFVRQFVAQVCKVTSIAADTRELPAIPLPDSEVIQETIDQALLLRGIEYLRSDVLIALWQSLDDRLREELGSFSGTVQDYLNHYNPRWNLVGRICFHLAENKKDENRPFAFLATYSTQLSKKAVAQHLPLKRALQDFAGKNNHAALLALLQPVQKAANESPFIKSLVDTGAIFQPQLWTAHEAHQFLKQVGIMESSGILVRIPNWWNAQKPPRPRVMVKVGESSEGSLGLDSLLDFDMHLALDNGDEITPGEWQELLSSSENLVKIKGQWVEVDRKKLEVVLKQWNKLQKAADNGLSMAEGLRLLAGAHSNTLDGNDVTTIEDRGAWSSIQAGSWLKSTLDQLKSPQESEEKYVLQVVEKHLNAKLRPYQLKGVSWLWLLYQLKLGGCLADDMGLGKTIQILTLLLLIKNQKAAQKETKKTHLLVVPASLLGNWQAEVERFAPSLNIYVVHSSLNNKQGSRPLDSCQLQGVDVIMTTYAFVHRLAWLKETDWNLIILDEAQLIKNAGTKQTQAVKSLKGAVRLALTGTPVENRLGDLWSLFDFTSPGLLGSAKEFSTYAKNAGNDNSSKTYKHFIGSLRNLTQPYILRRLKSDKTIITDLPDKTEMHDYCSSQRAGPAIPKALEEFSVQLKGARWDATARTGIILSLRFKQICNHPTQWLGYGDYPKRLAGNSSGSKKSAKKSPRDRKKSWFSPNFGKSSTLLPAS